MSLINEALKKAQRQRSLENAPLSQAPSGIAAAALSTHVRAASHKRSHAPLWFGLGLVSLGAVATVFVMRYGFSDAPPAAASAPAPAAATSPAVSASAPATPVATTPAAANAIDTAPMVMLPPIPQAAPASAPATATTVTAVAPAPVASVAPVAASPAPASAPAPVATPVAATPVAPAAPAEPLTPAEREAQVYAFLNSLRLTGVRGVDREARVLMNEKVWRLNDVVSPELGLRISAVRPNLLVFTDAQGKTYEKPY